MKSENLRPLSRRAFLRALAAATGSVAALPLLNACAPAATPIAPTSVAPPTAAVPPTTVPPTSAPPTAVPEAPQATSTPAPAPVTLRLWTYDDPGWIKASTDEIQRWSAKYPNVTIKHEHFPGGQLVSVYQTSMAAKNEADLIEMFGSLVHGYAAGNTLAPVPQGVMTLAEAQSLFYKAPLDGFVWKDTLYGFPHEFNLEVGGALVNKRMFEEASLTYPPDYKSWDALLSDAKKMTKWEGTTMSVSGFDYINFDGVVFWYLEGILERGVDYFADDKVHLNLNSKEAQDNLQWMVDLALKEKVVDANIFNPSVADVQDAFFQGRCAIGFRGPWVVPGGRVNYPKFADPWDYVSIPPLYGDQFNFPADSGWGIVVSPNSPNQTQAWEFAKFTCAIPENSRIWNVDSGTVPAMKAVAEDPTLLNDENWLGPCLKVIPNGRFVGDLGDHDFVFYNTIQPIAIQAMQGNISVKDAVDKINKDCNDKIDAKLQSG
jgi:multiple sugar transport system substrate-binding protein